MTDDAMVSVIAPSPDAMQNYEHWAGKPADPTTHLPLLVPQSIMDGWQCWCSCGKVGWFASIYEFESKEALLSALGRAHQSHVSVA